MEPKGNRGGQFNMYVEPKPNRGLIPNLDFFPKFSFGFLFKVRVWASTSFNFWSIWLPFHMFHESLPFQFIIHFFKQISSSKVFFFLSVQIQGTKVEDSLYVEFKLTWNDFKGWSSQNICVVFKRCHATKLGKK
jgi:hypothetical protein